MPFKLLQAGFGTLKNHAYSYDTLEEQIFELNRHYSHLLSMETIGESHEHRKIYRIQLGKGERKIHVNGAHHGNEWITSAVLVKSMAILCELYERNSSFYGMPIKRMLDYYVCYDFVPMVNPDGVDLVIRGLESISKKELIQEANGFEQSFSRWKANGRGVDLNRNYDAGFRDYQIASKKQSPSYAYYSGEYPGSEPESRALIELTNRRLYDMVLAYHTQGQVIYWDYKQIPVVSAKDYAQLFAKVSGYQLDVPDADAMGCGYKDWFIEVFRRPGYTIECGIGENPIDTAQLNDIVSATFPILLLAGRTKKKRG
ncbi:MAG: M14 family metallopeptidase [Cellulosilyticaceae bacterium]